MKKDNRNSMETKGGYLMFKRIFQLIVMLVVLVCVSTYMGDKTFAGTGNSDSKSINEKLGVPIVVYGETLTNEQKSQVRKLLGVEDPSAVEEFVVTAEDLVKYIDGADPHSRMFSSAKIVRKEQGEGLVINIVTAENITEVTNEMYANALLTAGVENALVEVASPVKVSGHSALTGIYKAYDVSGEALNKDRMEVANEELSIATKIANEEGMDKEKASELLTQIKKEIAEKNPATREDIKKIVEEQIQSMDLPLSAEDQKLLVDLFEKMRNLDISFENVSKQLDDIANEIRNKINQVVDNKGFWQGVENFVNQIVSLLKNLF
jgi:uncharacterized protein YpuA (DUF1002 family)